MQANNEKMLCKKSVKIVTYFFVLLEPFEKSVCLAPVLSPAVKTAALII